MGRRNTLPGHLGAVDWQPGDRLRLVRVPFVAGAYDQAGAYWGAPANLWIATETLPTPSGVTIFVRAGSRSWAKAEVRKLVPDARFYR